ncbi:MAG: prephenate dehydratase [Bacilli bacterium]
MIGYLGPKGTYTEQAARFFADSLHAARLAIRPYPSVSQTLDAVENGDVAAAAVPMENSLEGSIFVTLDRLATAPLRVSAEFTLPIRHAAFSIAGTDPQRILEVRSKPEALAQCRRTLRTIMPHADHVDMDSTAAAIHFVAQQGDPSIACVGDLEAGLAAGLRLLRMDVQDEFFNETRFALIVRAGEELPWDVSAIHGAGEPPLPDVYKTSLLLALGDDHPGALFEVLGVFARHGINLSRLESRPTRRGLGSYHFYIDLLQRDTDEDVRVAIVELGRLSGFSVKDLGSYACYSPLEKPIDKKHEI